MSRTTPRRSLFEVYNNLLKKSFVKLLLRQKKEREKEIESDLIAQLNQRRFDDKGVEDHVVCQYN